MLLLCRQQHPHHALNCRDIIFICRTVQIRDREDMPAKNNRDARTDELARAGGQRREEPAQASEPTDMQYIEVVLFKVYLTLALKCDSCFTSSSRFFFTPKVLFIISIAHLKNNKAFDVLLFSAVTARH